MGHTQIHRRGCEVGSQRRLSRQAMPSGAGPAALLIEVVLDATLDVDENVSGNFSVPKFFGGAPSCTKSTRKIARLSSARAA